jgi:hypothetical protein
MASRGHPTPFDPPTFFSAITGIATVALTHSHRIVPLIEVNVAWLAYLALIHWRARATGGKLLDVPVGFLYGIAVASWFLGLLLSAVYFVVYRGN